MTRSIRHTFPGRVAALAAALGLMTAGAWAQEGQPMPKRQAPQGAATQFEPPPAPLELVPGQWVKDRMVVDLGYLKPETTGEYTVELRNTSDEPLTLMRVTASCSCVRGKVESGKVVEPGQTASLEIEYDGGPSPAPISGKRLYVWWAGARGPAPIEITGDVTWAVRAEPFFLNLLEATTGTIVVESIDGRPFKVIRAGGKPPVFDMPEEEAGKPATRHVVRWDLTDVPPEKLERWWVIETDHSDAPLVDLRVIHPALFDLPEEDAAQAGGAWGLLLDRVFMGRIAPGQPHEFTQTLVNLREDTFEGVESPTGNLKIEVLSKEMGRRGLDLKLRITPLNGKPGILKEILVFKAGGESQQADVIAKVEAPKS